MYVKLLHVFILVDCYALDEDTEIYCESSRTSWEYYLLAN